MGVIGAAPARHRLVLVSESFIRVTFPLSLPGVFAGSLLTFIPAIGDYINAELLGNPQTRMIGNVIQNQFLTQNDYPTASALSFILMAGDPRRGRRSTPALLGHRGADGRRRLMATPSSRPPPARGSAARAVRPRFVDRYLLLVYTVLARRLPDAAGRA